MMQFPTYDDVLAAHERIRPHVHRTPVLTSSHLDGLAGARLFLKCENLQKIGAFKARGACNAVFGLSEAQAVRGVLTHSSGNHGQALAYAAAKRGIAATIVMPETSAKPKLDAVRGYGGRVVPCPAITRASAYGCTISAPVRSSSAATASSRAFVPGAQVTTRPP